MLLKVLRALACGRAWAADPLRHLTLCKMLSQHLLVRNPLQPLRKGVILLVSLLSYYCPGISQLRNVVMRQRLAVSSVP